MPASKNKKKKKELKNEVAEINETKENKKGNDEVKEENIETNLENEEKKTNSKKESSRKESRIEKELENIKSEISNEKEKSEDFDREKAKFATQRVPSIREELRKSELRRAEAEKEKIESSVLVEEKEIEEELEVNESDTEEKGIDEENEENETRGRRKKKKEKKKKKVFLRVLRFLFILGILGIICLAILLYGPWPNFRDWYITSAMTTMNHQWLATMFYDQNTIDEVMSKNKVIEVDGVTDNSLIKKITDEDNKQETKYANEYEKAVLERDPEHEDYKIIEIEGKAYNGYLAVVYDASKIHTMVTSKLDVVGEYVTDMAEREGAVLAINGGGFDDPNYSSNGGSPTGITFSRGKLLTNRNNTGAVGGLVGFNEDNVLMLGRMSASQAENMGIRDAVTTGCPFLIMNGQSSEIVGNGGWGQAARTVIGQRQDGIVLMLVLNGRNYATGILGADMDDLIEIMERYGAYNAACLDGGTSSVIVENGEILNDPIDGRGRHQTRFIPTAFGVFLDEE